MSLSFVYIFVIFKNEYGSYWPEDGYASYAPINVAFEEKSNEFAASGFVVRKFKLTDTRVRVIHICKRFILQVLISSLSIIIELRLF